MKKITFTFIVIVFFACQNIDELSKPKKLIEEDHMVEILTDIAFIKAAKGSYKKVFDDKKINLEAYILEKHGVDSLQFSENNRWYTGQMEKYKDLFTKVKSNLETSKVKYEKLKKVEDSIKKIEDSIKLSKGIKLQGKERQPFINQGGRPSKEALQREIHKIENTTAAPRKKKQFP